MHYCLLVFFVALARTQVTLLLSDTTTTTIISPGGLSITQESYHTGVNPNYLGTGAQWVWNSQADKWPDGYTNTFQALFMVDCHQVLATLRITADNQFTAYLNSAPTPILSGSNWLKPDYADIRLQCGINNLTVVVTNRDTNTPAALIFSITQNQQSCFTCPSPLTYYSASTCSCQCVGGCNCSQINPNWVWTGFPSCACTCPKILKCTDRKEFNPNTCSCQCRSQCPPGYTMNTTTCNCVVRPCWKIENCVKWREWSWASCSCGCQNIQNCYAGYRWDDNTCQCVVDKIGPGRPFLTNTEKSPALADQEVMSPTLPLPPPAPTIPTLPTTPSTQGTATFPASARGLSKGTIALTGLTDFAPTPAPLSP